MATGPFIQVTRWNDAQVVYVNAALIRAIYPGKEGAEIVFTEDDNLLIAEDVSYVLGCMPESVQPA